MEHDTEKYEYAALIAKGKEDALAWDFLGAANNYQHASENSPGMTQQRSLLEVAKYLRTIAGEETTSPQAEIDKLEPITGSIEVPSEFLGNIYFDYAKWLVEIYTELTDPAMRQQFFDETAAALATSHAILSLHSTPENADKPRQMNASLLKYHMESLSNSGVSPRDRQAIGQHALHSPDLS